MPFQRPGVIGRGKSEALFFRPAMVGAALAPHQLLRTVMAVASAQQEVTIVSENLEVEQVNPLRPADVKLGGLRPGGSEGEKAIVLNRREVPEGPGGGG